MSDESKTPEDFINKSKSNTQKSSNSTPNNQNKPNSSNGLATGAFVLSLLGYFEFGLIFALIGIGLGITSYNNFRNGLTDSGKGLSIAAIVIGAIALGISITKFASVG